jgi:hypothetical protein
VATYRGPVSAEHVPPIAYATCLTPSVTLTSLRIVVGSSSVTTVNHRLWFKPPAVPRYLLPESHEFGDAVSHCWLQTLGDEAHRYYDDLIGRLSQDSKHVLNLWGDPLTAAGVQSSDVKGAYVMVNIAGDQGTPLSNQSVDAIREVVDQSTPPAGVKARTEVFRTDAKHSICTP